MNEDDKLHPINLEDRQGNRMENLNNNRDNYIERWKITKVIQKK